MNRISSRISSAIVGLAVSTAVSAQTSLAPDAATATINVYAQAPLTDGATACHIAGHVTLWVSRPVRLRGAMREDLGTIEAGLAQFGAGAKVEGCAAATSAVDVSERFVNFLVANHGDVARVAAQLAAGTSQLTEKDGTLIPLLEQGRLSGNRATSSWFRIVLIRDTSSGSFAAAINRLTPATAQMQLAAHGVNGISSLAKEE